MPCLRAPPTHPNSPLRPPTSNSITRFARSARFALGKAAPILSHLAMALDRTQWVNGDSRGKVWRSTCMSRDPSFARRIESPCPDRCEPGPTASGTLTPWRQFAPEADGRLTGDCGMLGRTVESSSQPPGKFEPSWSAWRLAPVAGPVSSCSPPDSCPRETGPQKPHGASMASAVRVPASTSSRTMARTPSEAPTHEWGISGIMTGQPPPVQHTTRP